MKIFIAFMYIYFILFYVALLPVVDTGAADAAKIEVPIAKNTQLSKVSSLKLAGGIFCCCCCFFVCLSHSRTDITALVDWA